MLKRCVCVFMSAVLSVSCVKISTESTIKKTKIREWIDTEKNEPSLRIISASTDDRLVTGFVEEFRICQDFSKEENSRILENEKKAKWLWLELVGGAVLGGLGAYLLASAHTRSDKPGKTDDGDEIMSPRTTSYVVGGVSAGAGGILLGHGTSVAIRAIDDEEQMDNSIEVLYESDPYDCDTVGAESIAIKVSAPELGISDPVEVARTSDTGEFGFTLTDAKGFVFPADDSEYVVLTIHAGADETELDADDWIFEPVRTAEKDCQKFDSCVGKHNELKKENRSQKAKIRNLVKNRLVALARKNETSCRKFEKLFSGSNDFSEMRDIRDVCDLFVVQKRNTLPSVKVFLKKKRSNRTQRVAEQFAYNIISGNPTLTDCRWFEKRFKNSRRLGSIRDFILSLEYDGVPVSLLKCCSGGNLKVVDVLRNEKKGWSESLAIEQVMQSSSSFRVFSADEIEHLRRAGMRDRIIEAMIKKVGLAKKASSEKQRRSDYERREAARSQGDIKRCAVGCERDYRECADRRGRGLLDALIFDTTGCKPAYERCVAVCQE